MTSRTGGTFGAAATEQSLRAALLGVAQAVESGDLNGLERWCVDCCVTLSGATAAAVVDRDRGTEVARWRVSASDESVRELIELDLNVPTGLCRDCLDSGEPTTILDLFSPGEQWAEFATGARTLQFAWTHAQPQIGRAHV